ncbi:hypothetical protein FQN54_008843 [Arachnomyces sp. PD_36]|nr:hypothetical protein FQN54_008843 [Arachnomyces sp. PD_36]
MATPKPIEAYARSRSCKELKDFAWGLKKALKSSSPRYGRQCQYDKVSVIAFHWENDDMGVDYPETQLLEIFRDTYNYDTESYVIPVANSHISLQDKLNNWSLEHSGGSENTLRIYVYSGHAEPGGTGASRWYITGKRSGETGPKVDWWSIRAGIETVPGDMCYIFDCCSAGSVAMHDGPEAIAAVGWEQSASSMLDFCFTKALIDTLQELDGEPETLAGIYAKLFRNARENHIGAAPVHIPKEGAESITIARHSEDELLLEKSEVSVPKTKQRVLLNVYTRHDVEEADLKRWTKWMAKNIPQQELSADIRIEAVFRGSKVILVTMPVEIWTMLPADDPALNFIAHVESGNILPQLESSIQSSPLNRSIAHKEQGSQESQGGGEDSENEEGWEFEPSWGLGGDWGNSEDWGIGEDWKIGEDWGNEEDSENEEEWENWEDWENEKDRENEENQRPNIVNETPWGGTWYRLLWRPVITILALPSYFY